jgi:hypothetical protein
MVGLWVVHLVGWKEWTRVATTVVRKASKMVGYLAGNLEQKSVVLWVWMMVAWKVELMVAKLVAV